MGAGSGLAFSQPNDPPHKGAPTDLQAKLHEAKAVRVIIVSGLVWLFCMPHILIHVVRGGCGWFWLVLVGGVCCGGRLLVVVL